MPVSYLKCQWQGIPTQVVKWNASGVIFHPENARSINQDTGTHFNTLYELPQLILDQIGLSNIHGGIKQVGTVIKFATKFNSRISLEHKLLSSASLLSEDLRKDVTSIFEWQKRIFINKIEELRLSLQPGGTAA
jgi:hypothetical protein